MADNVQSAMFEMLTRIQADIAELKRNTASDFSAVNARLDKIEALQRKMRRNSAGMLVITRAAAGDFEERISSLEAAIDRRRD